MAVSVWLAWGGSDSAVSSSARGDVTHPLTAPSAPLADAAVAAARLHLFSGVTSYLVSQLLQFVRSSPYLREFATSA